MSSVRVLAPDLIGVESDPLPEFHTNGQRFSDVVKGTSMMTLKPSSICQMKIYEAYQFSDNTVRPDFIAIESGGGGRLGPEIANFCFTSPERAKIAYNELSAQWAASQQATATTALPMATSPQFLHLDMGTKEKPNEHWLNPFDIAQIRFEPNEDPKQAAFIVYTIRTASSFRVYGNCPAYKVLDAYLRRQQ